LPGQHSLNTIKKWDRKGKFGGAATCAMTDGMVVARIAKASATNDHRRAFKFSLTFWFFCVKTKEQLNKIINLKFKIMATTSFTTFKLTITAAQLKTANNIAIDIPQLPAPGRGYAWSVAMAELRFFAGNTAFSSTTLFIITDTAAI
jgi:hypothetical protein